MAAEMLLESLKVKEDMREATVLLVVLSLVLGLSYRDVGGGLG